MLRAEPPIIDHSSRDKLLFRKGAEAQCRLLAEQGYIKPCFCDPLYSGEEHCTGFCKVLHDMGLRKVPSEEEISQWFQQTRLFPFSPAVIAEEFHKWLMGEVLLSCD